jgi:tetratricopeptide (TPR) repeat protein
MALPMPGPRLERAPEEDIRARKLSDDLPRRARALIDEGELDGYRGLFDRAEAIENPHRRYWANTRVAEQGLAAAATTARTEVPTLLDAVCAGALQALEREPREPRLLNQAGVALYGLDMIEAAAAMLDGAARLDPELDGLQQSRAAIAARRALPRRPRRRAELPTATSAERSRLAARALALAAEARPAEGLRLSLCMIVRDEQEMLPRCLSAVAAAVDEIVIVDTGSTDATIEIARSFGARVIERGWTGSFAQARNVSFDAANGDWLIYLDADEVLAGEDLERLRALTGCTWREAFYLSETNHTGEIDGGTAVAHSALRVLRNRPEYRFEGRLHEQIAHRLPGYLPERVETTGIRVEHYGYLGVVRDLREKSRRNIELLRLSQRERPATPFLLYNLGSEYAAAGEHTAAVTELQKAQELLEALPDRDSYRFAPALMCRLVRSLRISGRAGDALARAQVGLEHFPELTDLVLEQARAANALGERDRAIALCERCIEMGDAPVQYTASVGSGSYLALVLLGELLRAGGDTTAAIETLERCLREHPDFTGSVLPYANALMDDGCEAEEVLSRVERALGDPSPAARFMLATALFERGANAAGEAQFRAVLECQPHSARARVALGEALLAQRRYEEAAIEAAALAVEDSLAALACRTELFARIAGGDVSGAVQALARAREAGMPGDELQLFCAWHEIASSGQTSVTLTSEAVGLLELMLEALLRVQDFETFEVLLGVLGRAPLVERERRELLAQMYLRRGLEVSAAQEWMAVCEEKPDARALLGLARVAAIRGMPREAREFATAAISHEPENAQAAALLAQVTATSAGA